MIPTAQEKPLITIDEFLKAVPGWPQGRSAMHEAVRRGELPSMRLGNRVFLITAQLRQLLGLDDARAGPPTRNEAPVSIAEAPPSSFVTPDRQVRRLDGL
jgi:hypothetical protein